MRISTIAWEGREEAALCTPAGMVLVDTVGRFLGKEWSRDTFELIESGQLREMNDWYRDGGRGRLGELKTIPAGQVVFRPLYRRPRKIWGIGLNYVEHALDLVDKPVKDEPASFMKPDTTIIGPGDAIKIPLQSEATTAEAELGLIIGKRCKDVEREHWLDVVAGFTTLLDMTAEDILRRNPRYLTRSKSFDTFLSFGPQLVTPDEIDDILKLKVATVHNGRVHAQNSVGNMTFTPDDLVSFHSKVMTLLPGDLICTGTPRAVRINDGDVVECRIDGFASLANPVIDLKVR